MSANQLDHEFSFTYSVRCRCKDCVKTKASMRALRLWHWQIVVDSTKREQWAHKQGELYKNYADAAKSDNAFHMKIVQTLNDFFPEGDTAEKDATK